MSPTLLFGATGIGLFALGLAAAVGHSHLLRKVLALNLAGSGVFLLFIALAYRGPQASPDPVPHALVLTGLVVSVSATALLLALVRRIFGGKAPAALPEDAPKMPQ